MKKHLLAALVAMTGSSLHAADNAGIKEELDQWKESLAAAQHEWRLRRLHPTTRDKCLEVIDIVDKASFDLNDEEDAQILTKLVVCANAAMQKAQAHAGNQQKFQQKKLEGLNQKLAVYATPPANADQDDQKAVKPTEKPESKKKGGNKKAA